MDGNNVAPELVPCSNTVDVLKIGDGNSVANNDQSSKTTTENKGSENGTPTIIGILESETNLKKESRSNNQSNVAHQAHVLLNPLVFSLVMNYLDLDEIISCRGVHPMWNNEAKKYMSKNAAAVFRFVIHTNAFDLVGKEKFESWEPALKIQYLQNLPVDSFKIIIKTENGLQELREELKDSILKESVLKEELQPFEMIFETCIKTIKNLEIDMFSNYECFAKLSQIMRYQFENLDFLKIHFNPLGTFEGECSFSHCFPKLTVKTLQIVNLRNFAGQIGLLCEILFLFPNLTSLIISKDNVQYDDEFLNTILADKILHQVQSYKNLQTLEIVVDSFPTIDKLMFIPETVTRLKILLPIILEPYGVENFLQKMAPNLRDLHIIVPRSVSAEFLNMEVKMPKFSKLVNLKKEYLDFTPNPDFDHTGICLKFPCDFYNLTTFYPMLREHNFTQQDWGLPF